MQMIAHWSGAMMSGRQTTTTRSTKRVIAAVILLQALGVAAPAAASSNSLALCNRDGKDLQQLPPTVLKPVTGTGAEESDLATELADDAGVPEFSSSSIELETRTAPRLPLAMPRESMRTPTENVLVPAILAEALARYRKQMYRKDI